MKRPALLIHPAPPEYAGLGPLPVRVRSQTGELIGSGLTGVPIEVPPGSYYVTMLLPDGREIGHDRKVRASAGQQAESPAIRPSSVQAPIARPVSEPAAPHEADLTIGAGIWEGNWLKAWANGVPVLAGIDTGGRTLSSGEVLTIAHEDGRDRLLVVPLEDRLRCAVIPFDECLDCVEEPARARAIGALLSASPEGPLVLFRSVVSEETNALLGFVESRVFNNMVTVTESEVRTSEQAMSQARRSIFRAVTGAYVMLRANALEGLAHWLGQLVPLQDRLPDVLPLRAELAARTGDHAAAVALIAEWTASGRCPWFRAGFSYMLERLKIYLEVTDNRGAEFNLKSSDYGRFAAARDVLDRMLPTMLTSYYIATFDLPRGTPDTQP